MHKVQYNRTRYQAIMRPSFNGLGHSATNRETSGFKSLRAYHPAIVQRKGHRFPKPGIPVQIWVAGPRACRGVGRPRNLVTVEIAGSNPVMPAKRIMPKRSSKEVVAAYNRKLYKISKDDVLTHYGTSCAQCGFSDERALQIDHTGNNGAQERLRLGHRHCAGYPFYRWLKREGWPSGYQVLCANCNLIKYVESLSSSRFGNRPLKPGM
jgi:hypothetical protein